MRILSLAIVLAALSVSAASAQDGIQFLQLPAFKDKLAAWPHDAAGHPYFGSAKVDCFIKADGDGEVNGCTIAEEEPSGHGIGEAAVKLVSQYRARATDRVQKLPDGRVRIEITLRFDTPALLIKGATPEQIRAAYPKEADGRDGKARISCATDPSLALKNCVIVSEEPANAGFGKAALSLVSAYTMHPATANGTPVSTRVQFPVSFTQSVITNPDWLRKPTVDELSSAWPLEASNRGLDHGRAVITCVVTVRGALESCVVASEEPKDAGFGPAAIVLAPLMLMKPETKDGQPVGGAHVSIPIAFTNPGFGTTRGVPKGMTGYQIRTPIWATAPDSDLFAKQFPTAAKGKAATGHVVLTCHPAKDGSLKRCETRQETPQGLDFGKAAFALSTMFRANMAGLEDKVGTLSVDVPFFFIDPASAEWQSRAITKPMWIAAPGPDEVTAAFPKKAHDAKETKGIGRASCMVGAGGHLIDCHAAGEAPAGLGFADAAVILAPKFAMNPWSAEGLPVDGVRLTLPVQLVDGFDAPVADAGQTAPPTAPTKP